MLKEYAQECIEDKDIWENNKQRLRFRKFPWPFWFIGSLWILGACWIIYDLAEHLRKFTVDKIYKEYFMLLACILIGCTFLYFGKIRTIVFDKKEGTMTVKKRNTFCDKRSITTYRLNDITDVRAVQRGTSSGGVNNAMYMIIVEFNRFAD